MTPATQMLAACLNACWLMPGARAAPACIDGTGHRPLSPRTVGVWPAGARAAVIASAECALMKLTTKIRFTEAQIAFVMRAHPNCNLDHLSELSFEFDQAGKVIDCIGTIEDGGNIDHNYAGTGLARLYERARRQLTARQTRACSAPIESGGFSWG